MYTVFHHTMTCRILSLSGFVIASGKRISLYMCMYTRTLGDPEVASSGFKKAWLRSWSNSIKTRSSVFVYAPGSCMSTAYPFFLHSWTGSLMVMKPQICASMV